MVAFYGPDETEEILGSLLADETYHTVFLHAQEELDPHLPEIPAGGAAAAYRALVKRHGRLGNPFWRVRVAGDLLDIGARLGNSGEYEHSIEYNEELIRRFDSTPIPEVQTAVARALLNKAVATQRVSDSKGAWTAFQVVVNCFGESEVPDIQECVGAALLNTGFYHDRLGEPEAAMACYDAVVGRFANSLRARLRLCVAMSLQNKGSTLAGLESPSAMDRAITTWEGISSSGSARTASRTSRSRSQPR